MSTSEMWDRLEKTDPKFTKPFNRGGFKGTALNATYVLKKLTKEFGPCGEGWKFVIDNEQIVVGHTLNELGDKAQLHKVLGHIEYKRGEQWFATSPQFGQTMLVTKDSRGVIMDEEAPKKSITDAIGKCAVTLGIGADISLGMFDDNKYVNDRREEEAAAANGNGNGKTKPASSASLKRDGVWERMTAGIDACTTTIELGRWLEKNQGEMESLREDWTAELWNYHNGRLAELRAKEKTNGKLQPDAWAKTALAEIASMRTWGELDAWEIKNEKALLKLKDVAQGEWAKVKKSLTERMTALSTQEPDLPASLQRSTLEAG